MTGGRARDVKDEMKDPVSFWNRIVLFNIRLNVSAVKTFADSRLSHLSVSPICQNHLFPMV